MAAQSTTPKNIPMLPLSIAPMIPKKAKKSAVQNAALVTLTTDARVKNATRAQMSEMSLSPTLAPAIEEVEGSLFEYVLFS